MGIITRKDLGLASHGKVFACHRNSDIWIYASCQCFCLSACLSVWMSDCTSVCLPVGSPMRTLCGAQAIGFKGLGATVQCFAAMCLLLWPDIRCSVCAEKMPHQDRTSNGAAPEGLAGTLQHMTQWPSTLIVRHAHFVYS